MLFIASVVVSVFLNIILASPTHSSHVHYEHDELTVKTPSGTYIGLVNGTTPHVRQFRSIPFAAPPVGERRWLPPAKRQSNSSVVLDVTQFPPSCPQYVSKPPSIFNTDVPEWLFYNDEQNKTAGESGKETSEDCLQLAVWTPTDAPKDLPVIMFMTGGAFVSGAVNIPYQLPHHWVERTQSHIVVTINYRLNIMGFPNAAGLESQNLGILDQRMALEWVRDNIKAFGGNPEKITLWGQSAGAAATDFHNFAYADDPIVTGYLASSGSAYLGISSNDQSHSNFSFVAENLGCGDLSASAELDCMRKVPFDDIQNFVGGYSGQSAITFYPVPDDKIIFSNYSERYALGAYSKRPAIFSTNTNEGAATAPYPPTDAAVREQGTLGLFLCPASQTSKSRTEDGSVTYRFEFAGNFSNVSPKPYLGAYHDSDLTMLFGTHPDFRGESTKYEYEVSESMQDHVLEFMKDPIEGPKSLGWLPYAEDQILLFGSDGLAVQQKTVKDIDGRCA